MKPTNEQLRQFAREIMATIQRVLGLSDAETARPGWYDPSALNEAQKEEIRTAARPVIMAFARRYPQ